MHKEFVPYEQALALKELGFNEPCFACVDEDGIYLKGDIRFNSTKQSYAPLYQQAFRWFRDKNYEVYYSKKEDGTITFRIEYGYWNFISDESFLDYEKAESVCLKKLIEINIIQNQSRQK